MPLGDLYDPLKGYLMVHTCLIEVEVLVRRPNDSVSDSGCEQSKEKGATGNKAASDNQIIAAQIEEIITLSELNLTAPVFPSLEQQNLHTPQLSLQIQSIETTQNLSDELRQKGMNTFFPNMESELESTKTVSLQEVKEALAKIEEALKIAPADIDDSGRISSIQKAFKVLSSCDCSSAFTFNQKAEVLSKEKEFKELPERAAKAIKEKNLLTEKEPIKLTVSQNLKNRLIKYKQAKAETEEIKLKIAILQAQVDSLNSQINDELKKEI